MYSMFKWWWLLLGMAGLFVALAVASAVDGNWAGVPLSLGFAALMVAGAFYHRRKLRMLEAMLAQSTPALGRGDLDYEGPSRAMNRVLFASALVIVGMMIYGSLYTLTR
jgi:hypothetical protein